MLGRLSGIAEVGVVSAKLTFVVVGKGAKQLAENVCAEAAKSHPDIQDRVKKTHGSLGGQNSLTARGAVKASPSLTSTPSTASSVSVGAWNCVLPFVESDDATEAEAVVGAAAKARESKARKSAATKYGLDVSDRVSRISSKFGGGWKSDSGTETLKLHWTLVENFSDDFPRFRSEEHWRNSCVIFLCDIRDEEFFSEHLGDLQRRQLEVAASMKNFLTLNAELGYMPQQALVLLHGERSDSNPLPEGPLTTFVEAVSGMARIPQEDSDVAHHFFCDFADGHALLKLFTDLSSGILSKRKTYEYTSILAMLGEDNASNTGCCSLM